MTSTRRMVQVAGAAFASAMIGQGLQFLLPVQMVVDGRAAIGAIAGIVALLLALVLGLLIWTSYGVFAAQQSEIQSLGLTMLQLDYLLESYGPETRIGRLGLRESARRSRERYFGNHGPVSHLSFSQARNSLHRISAFYEALRPESDEKKQILARAKPMAEASIQAQVLIERQLVNPVPTFLVTMVQIWSCLLFLAYGLMANVSLIAAIADGLGACAIAGAMVLIDEFSEPYAGFVRIKPDHFDRVIAELATNTPSG